MKSNLDVKKPASVTKKFKNNKKSSNLSKYFIIKLKKSRNTQINQER